MDFEQMKKIVDGAPDGATHYIDNEKGFDYLRIDLDELWLDIWNPRFNCWLPIGYIDKSKIYKPL